MYFFVFLISLLICSSRAVRLPMTPPKMNWNVGISQTALVDSTPIVESSHVIQSHRLHEGFLASMLAWSSWIIRTGVIGGLICVIPLPKSITDPMKLGVLTVIIACLVLESGFQSTSRSIDRVVGGASALASAQVLHLDVD